MVKKRVPKPKSEQAEREFWANKDSSEYHYCPVNDSRTGGN